MITGASGNVGTSVIEALARDDRVSSIIGLARRVADWSPPKTEWRSVDVTRDDLTAHFMGADAVVHLAWLIQPSRDERALRTTNVHGSERVFAAVARAGVPSLVYASSVGAYSPGPQDRRVDEGWPTEGVDTSFYSRHKAEVERILDRFEREHSGIRVVRLRPGLIFKGEAASEIRRLFAGPFLPSFLVDRRLIPVVPLPRGLRLQAVHSRDVGDAYRLAVTGETSGPFNLAAEPEIGPQQLAELLDARPLSVQSRVVRALTSLTWRLRLQPTPAGWLDMGLSVPLLDTTRAREVLGWHPAHSSLDALAELMEGIRRGEGAPTPPLDPDTGGPARRGELKTGVGAKG